MRKTITIEVELVPMNCCVCGIAFAFDADVIRARRRDHQWFYCPVGHEQHFAGESDEEQLARELKEARLEISRAEYRAQTEQLHREFAEKSLRATKASVTKLKKRIANGVCPCCHRTFAQLGRHMANKHPEYEKKRGGHE